MMQYEENCSMKTKILDSRSSQNLKKFNYFCYLKFGSNCTNIFVLNCVIETVLVVLDAKGEIVQYFGIRTSNTTHRAVQNRCGPENKILEVVAHIHQIFPRS